MSHNLSANCSSPNASPCSPPPLASPGRSPLPSSRLCGHDAEGSSSDNYLTPTSARYDHPSASSSNTSLYSSSLNSVAGGAPVHSLLNSQRVHATQPSTSTHQLNHSTYQTNLSPHQAAYPVQLPFPQGPYHHPPVMNIPDPTILHPIHSPQNSPPLDAVQPFHSHYTRYQSQGMFSGSHNLAFTDNTFIDNSTTSNNFMKELLQHTIIGAEFDSSDRDPPPRCHPGTRLAIVERCKIFIVQCNGKQKMRWVVGAAGVGKSAIMQIVAEEPPDDVILGASVFISVNGRKDGTKVFMTIAYQLAVKCEPYRQLIEKEVNRDPSLLRKSLSVQFQKFIVGPFIHQHLFNPSNRFLIIIDGLDECDSPHTQQEILGLISRFCISYPTSPIVWLVASRPEPHITSFFDDSSVASSYTKEEIEIDSDEACEDVQRYLRDELNKVKLAYPTLKRKREWPSGLEFTKIATAAGGLFAYASTVVRYIGDRHYRNPATQLRHVLEAICAGPKDDESGRDHPMAQLDALYQRILSNIPDDVMIDTRKLLLTYMDDVWRWDSFRTSCNRLGLSEDAAYGAVCHLHAVLKILPPDKADDGGLEFFHKSFSEFLFDFKRSGFSHNIIDEVEQLQAQASFRIVEQLQVPESFDMVLSGRGIKCYDYGYLKGDRGSYENISLSWPGDESFLTSDDHLRAYLYQETMSDMCRQFVRSRKFYRSLSCFHGLTTRFTELGPDFPTYELRDSMFEEFRSELTEQGKFKQVPLRTLNYAAICGGIDVDVRVMSCIGRDARRSDSRNPVCKHFRSVLEDGDGSPQWRGCKISFDPGANTGSNIRADKYSHQVSTRHDDRYSECLYCSRRFSRHIIDNPDQLATVFVDSTEMCYVELSVVDPDDSMLEWRYRFFHSGSPSFVD